MRQRHCDFKGCGNLHHGGGLCKQHYQAQWNRSTRPRKTINPWTKEVRAQVADMLLEKLSASQISTRLRPGIVVSRNAVVGVVHRDPILKAIGLQGGSGAPRKPSTPRIKKSRIAGVLAAPKPRRSVELLFGKQFYAVDLPKLQKMPKPTPVAFECRSVPMVDLKPHECKWAVNNSETPDGHLFCGNAAEPGRPYCEGHWPLSIGYGTRSEQLADRRNRPDFRRAA